MGLGLYLVTVCPDTNIGHNPDIEADLTLKFQNIIGYVMMEVIVKNKILHELHTFIFAALYNRKIL